MPHIATPDDAALLARHAARLKTASPPVGFIAQGVASNESGQISFRESDVTRAIRAAAKAGKDVKIEIDLDRRCMSIIPIKTKAE